jgi:hypothetical protein
VVLRYLKVEHDTEMKKRYGDGEINEAEEEKKPKEVPRKIMEESLQKMEQFARRKKEKDGRNSSEEEEAVDNVEGRHNSAAQECEKDSKRKASGERTCKQAEAGSREKRNCKKLRLICEKASFWLGKAMNGEIMPF